MSLFISTFVNKIDKKGRVSVPAPFRAAVAGQGDQGVVLFGSHTHQALEGFSPAAMADIAARLDHFDLFSAPQDDLATTIFGESVALPFDGDGRIILPEKLMDYAGLSDRAAFVGLGGKFQIWEPDEFELRRLTARGNVKAQGLTLPKGGAS